MGAEHLKPWRAGESGNPCGRPKLPAHLRAIKSLSIDEVRKYVSKYARMQPDEVDALVLARSIPMLELSIARIFQESAKKGDFTGLAFLLERAIGKVPAVAPPDEESEALKEIQDLSDQELLRLVRDKLPSLDQANGT